MKKYFAIATVGILLVLYTNMGAAPIDFNNVYVPPPPPPPVHQAQIDEYDKLVTKLLGGQLGKTARILKPHLRLVANLGALKAKIPTCASLQLDFPKIRTGYYTLYPEFESGPQLFACFFKPDGRIIQRADYIVDRSLGKKSLKQAWLEQHKKLNEQLQHLIGVGENAKVRARYNETKQLISRIENDFTNDEFRAVASIIDSKLGTDPVDKDVTLDDEIETTVFIRAHNTAPPESCGENLIPVACISGESRLPNVGPIDFPWGVWGGPSQAGSHVRHIVYSGHNASNNYYCYRPGQKQDNDGTDRVVGYVCKSKGTKVGTSYYGRYNPPPRTGDDR